MKSLVIVLVAFLAQGHTVSIANFPSLNLQISNPIAHHSDETPQLAVLPSQQENVVPVFGVLPSNLEEESEMVNLPIQISNLPALHGNEVPSFGVLPSNIESDADMVNLPIQIGHLPALHGDLDVGFGVLPSNLEPEANNDVAQINDLPAPEQAQATPPCVGYIRNLLMSVLSQLDAPASGIAAEIANLPSSIGDSVLDIANLPAKVEDLPVGLRPEVPLPSSQDESPLAACAACFQKVQLLVEKANSLNSIVTF